MEETAHANVLNMSAGLATGLAAGLEFGLGLAIVFAISINRTEWPSYQLTRWRLALHHQLPWSLMDFLSDAYRRGVLRQAGAVYQFRHVELQHRLANRDADERQANSPAVAATKADG